MTSTSPIRVIGGNPADTPSGLRLILPASIGSLRRIVNDRQACKLRWEKDEHRPKYTVALVDMNTAAAVVGLYDRASLIVQSRIEARLKEGPHWLAKLAAIAWKGKA